MCWRHSWIVCYEEKCKKGKKKRQQGVTHTPDCIAAPKKRKEVAMRSFRMVLLGV